MLLYIYRMQQLQLTTFTKLIAYQCFSYFQLEDKQTKNGRWIDYVKLQLMISGRKLNSSSRFFAAGMLQRNIMKRNWQVKIFRKKIWGQGTLKLGTAISSDFR